MLKDRAIKTRLLPDHTARFIDGSLGRSRHIGDFKRLDTDHAIARRKFRGLVVVPVLADTRRLGLQCRRPFTRFSIPFGTAPAPARGLLRGFMPPVEDSHSLNRRVIEIAIGQRQGIGDATIYPNCGAEINGSFVLNFASKTNMPAERIERDGCVFDDASQWPCVAKLHPAYFRQANARPIAVQSLDLNLTALKSETIVDAFFARRGVFGAARKEIGESFIEVAQSLLLASLRNGGDPIELGSKNGQFASLRDVIELRSGFTLVCPPPNTALLQAEIVDQAANARELLEQETLFNARSQLVLETAKDHIANIALGLRICNMSENADIRRGRHVVYALHAHLVFVTKYRRGALSQLAIRDLRLIFSKVCKDFEAELVECNGEDDHVHLLLNYPPKLALSKLVNSLKGVSSRLLRAERQEVNMRGRDKALWSPSYFVGSCGGAPLSVIAEYVQSQRVKRQLGRPSASGGPETAIPPRPEGRGISRKVR